MTTKVVPGQLVAAPEPSEVARESARRIARVIRGAQADRAQASLALSGGHTPRSAYSLLAHEPGIDWTCVDVFWVDERAVPPTDDRSNFRWAKATLLDPAGVPPHRVHRMPADAPDAEAAAREYEQMLRDLVPPHAHGIPIPAFDAMVLGIGDDGHTASLFPHDPTVDVTDRLVVPVKARGGREARLTITAPVIEHGRHVFVIAVGTNKLAALESVWAAQGDVAQTPARVVRGCRGMLTWIIDKAAGGLA
ncbi:MAG: 6-phosphogluconolactonase [Myxococcota bacterium]|nr:6-phosphogluconolactonase [Myxococcota bacterium]